MGRAQAYETDNFESAWVVRPGPKNLKPELEGTQAQPFGGATFCDCQPHQAKHFQMSSPHNS